MKKYAVVYVNVSHKDEKPFVMPSFIYDSNEEAQLCCDNLNTITKQSLHFVQEIN